MEPPLILVVRGAEGLQVGAHVTYLGLGRQERDPADSVLTPKLIQGGQPAGDGISGSRSIHVLLYATSHGPLEALPVAQFALLQSYFGERSALFFLILLS